MMMSCLLYHSTEEASSWTGAPWSGEKDQLYGETLPRSSSPSQPQTNLVPPDQEGSGPARDTVLCPRGGREQTFHRFKSAFKDASAFQKKASPNLAARSEQVYKCYLAVSMPAVIRDRGLWEEITWTQAPVSAGVREHALSRFNNYPCTVERS